MLVCSMTRRCLLLAGTIGTLATVTSPAASQQAPAPEAPPPWAQGRPDAAIRANLAPIVPPPLPTAVDKLPTTKLKAPAGFKVELYASDVGNARTLRQGDKGTVFVSSRILDKVYAIVDKDGKHEVKTLYSGLYRPNGLAIHNGTLYIAELAKISKVERESRTILTIRRSRSSGIQHWVSSTSLKTAATGCLRRYRRINSIA
jgi:hypothetical protein